MPTTALAFASVLSTSPNTAEALAELFAAAADQLPNADLAVLFTSPHHRAELNDIAGGIRRRLGARRLLGCTGESIVGVGREIERQPAMSLWLAKLPGVRIEPLRLAFEQTPDGGSFLGWPDSLAGAWPEGATLLILADPFTFPADEFLARLNEDRPGAPVVGGMASGGTRPGQNLLLLDDDHAYDGAVGLWLHGPVRVRTVVSQGCRPIGRPFVVTKAEANIIHQLGGKPALAQFQDLFAELDPSDQERVRQGLHLGRVTNEYREAFGRGDFLVRNVLGADAKQGLIAIGDQVRTGQTVQFHVRDADSADEDLRELLRQAPPAASRGALMFTCNGRGTRLFPQPHHDAGALGDVLGDVPLAGFFAQGEIGPIGGQNFLHGFTASIALVEPAL